MTPETEVLIRAELERARRLFPNPPDAAAVMLALMEEVGELATAMLEGRDYSFLEEAVQVASTAIRVIEDTLPAESAAWNANARC